MHGTGIAPLDIPFKLNGNLMIIHPVLIWDEETLIMVDAGFPGQLPAFGRELERLDISLDRLDKIIVTHHDWDHIGGLAEIVSASARDVEVVAHELERPFIQGDKMFVKKREDSSDIKGAPTKPQIQPFARVKVNRVVTDGEVLPYCGGITVIHTPGHTPGHICLYHKESRTLITGDALNVADGNLIGPNPLYTHDLEMATESLKKLSLFHIETVICYHGGLFQGDVDTRIAELAKG